MGKLAHFTQNATDLACITPHYSVGCQKKDRGTNALALPVARVCNCACAIQLYMQTSRPLDVPTEAYSAHMRYVHSSFSTTLFGCFVALTS